ncbi:MAG: NAD-dependent DNA ligase LigA [Firmicutes bacterium]|nr:NAD-dependent DNA ligase LigA [Bacillota bacterium]
MKRIDELKELIKKYDLQYYELGTSEISDAEYDRLYEEYAALEKEFPEYAEMADSPTKRVGAGSAAGTTTGLPKITHKSPLLSIDRKAKELSELEDFYNKCGGDGTEVIVQPKLDGITCNINYENGKLINAATRGNGYIGDLITENFKNTDTKYPEEVENFDLEVRGEAIIPFDFFKKKLQDDYSNPRNAVAGIMRQIEPKDVKGKGIQVMFYDIGQTNLEISDKDSDNVNILKSFDFQIVPVICASTWEELKVVVESRLNGYIQQIEGFNVLMDSTKEFPQAVCDGLVIKVNSRKKREEIGFSQKGPKWAFAYKFKPLQEKTIINRVVWQVGKTGRITPVAEFNEISLGGTKINRATLNNFDYMKQMGLEYNDTIVVERSNDVIPRVVEVASHNEIKEANEEDQASFQLPCACPVCGGKIKELYPLHYCENPFCSAQIKGKIVHYASRDAMNIVGLGEGIVDTLFENELLKDIPSIYQLLEKREELEALPKFAKKKVDNLFKSIEKTKSPELWQFIYSLSIPEIGKKASKDLAQRYLTIEHFLEATYEELIDIEFFGGIMAQNVMDYLENEDFIQMIKTLFAYGVHPQQVEVNSDELKGKTFVITGTLANPRKFYQDIIEKMGGKCAGSVSKKTTAVLIGSDAGSKETKARELVAKGEPIVLLESEEAIQEYFGVSY